MTRVIIKAVKEERPDCVAYLKKHIPEAEFCFDQNRDAMDTFLRSLEMAGKDAVIHMEEDIWLTENWRIKIEEAISEFPEVLIQFFSMRKDDIEVGSRWDYGRNFLMNQCVYYPAGLSLAVREYARSWDKYDTHPTGTDSMVADFLQHYGLKYWIHVPNLVDHREEQSLINSKRSSARTSKTFKDPIYE